MRLRLVQASTSPRKVDTRIFSKKQVSTSRQVFQVCQGACCDCQWRTGTEPASLKYLKIAVHCDTRNKIIERGSSWSNSKRSRIFTSIESVQFYRRMFPLMNDWYINSILNSKPTLFHLACSVALMCDMAHSPPGNSRFPPRGPHRVEPLPGFRRRLRKLDKFAWMAWQRFPCRSHLGLTLNSSLIRLYIYIHIRMISCLM